MYLKHFGLREEPFALTTDPRFLFLSPAHAQAQACLDFAVLKGDGIVVITGAIGAGKSTLAHDVAERAANEVVVVHNTRAGATGLFQEILAQLGQREMPKTKAELLIALRRELATRLQSGTRTVLIVDEAQHLDAETLEDLRMLADEQVSYEKPMSVVLVGQPSLATTLQGAGLEQVRQRIRLHFHLPPLTLDDTERYLAHRLCVAGKNAPSKPIGVNSRVLLFDQDAVTVMHRYTGGVPRLINVLADLGLMAAWMEETRLVTAPMIASAVKDLGWVPYRRRRDKEPREVSIIGARPGLLAMLRNSLWSQLQALRGLWLDYRSRLGVKTDASPMAQLKTRIAALRERFVAPGTAEQSTLHAILTADGSRRVAAWSAAAVSIVLLLAALAVPGLRSDDADAPSLANTGDKLSVADTEFATDASRDIRAAPAVPQLVAMLDPAPLYMPETLRHAATAIVQPADTPDEPAAANELTAVNESTTASKDVPGLHEMQQSIDLPSAPWLLQQPPESYVIQVFATHKPDNLSRFAKLQELDQMAYYHKRRDGEDWYVLLTGQYPSYEQAKAASTGLPGAVLRSKPWVRKMALVQTDIRETGAN